MMIYRIILYILSSVLFIHNINADSSRVQDTPNHQENLLKSLHYELRDNNYCKKVLRNNFNHLSNLIVAGNTANHSPLYLESVIHLFSNLLKRSDYVNAYAFEK